MKAMILRRFAILLIIVTGVLAHNKVQAQSTSNNPVNYLKGTWLRKVTSVSPVTDDLSWKDVHTIVEFKSILEGNGLLQIAFEGTKEVEVYYFFDSSVQKLYGMNVDANGYVWQTEMSVNKDGSFGEVVGQALNDTSAKETVELTQVSENEMTFKYKVFKNNKAELTAEGVFLRIPKY